MATRLTLVTLMASLGAIAPLAGCGGEDADPTPRSERSERSAERDGRKAAERPPLARAERLLFIGDSLSIAGASANYPDLLARTVPGGLGVENLGQHGATSKDWLPGGALFGALEPHLESADAVLVTVGGNDLERAVGGADGAGALGEAADRPDRVVAAMDRFERNLRRTIRAIRRASPETAVVFVGYPDYSASSAWQERVGPFELMGLRAGLRELQTRAGLAGADVVADMLDATGGGDADRLLSEGEYLGEAGHRLYARRLSRLIVPSR